MLCSISQQKSMDENRNHDSGSFRFFRFLLFLDNAPSYPETLQGNLKNIKLVFLPKNTTSQLQPCDAGIIRNFKVKYRKQLLKHLISRIDDEKAASEFIQGVDLLQCMRWVNQAFEQITKDTIKHCFEKCRFSEVSFLAEGPDDEFENLLKSLTIDVMPKEYASFDDDVDTSEMPINVQKKGWEDILLEHCIEKVNTDPDEIDISSDDSDVEDNYHMEAIEEENPQISFAAALQMLNQLQDFASSFADTEIQCQLATITEKLQDVRLQRRKQVSIKGTVMQIEKGLINDRLRVSKVS